MDFEKILCTLKPSEEKLLRERFGLDEEAHQASLEEIEARTQTYLREGDEHEIY